MCWCRCHHLELHWGGAGRLGIVFVMVVDPVVYDNRLRLRRRNPGGRAPVVTTAGADVEAFVDVVGWAWWGWLITWLGPATVVEADIDIVPIVVTTAAVTHRELDSGKRNFVVGTDGDETKILEKLCNTVSDNIVCGNSDC